MFKNRKSLVSIASMGEKSSKINGKMFIFIYLSNNESSVAAISSHRIRHDQCLVLLYYLHQKIMPKKSEILKKRNFLDQALDFLPPRKPGLYISLVDFFFFKYHEHTLSSGQNLSKSWYLWPNLETFLVKTIPRFAFAGRCPLLNYYLNKRYFNIYPEI